MVGHSLVHQKKKMSFDRAELILFVIFGDTGDLARRKLLPALVRARARIPRKV